MFTSKLYSGPAGPYPQWVKVYCREDFGQFMVQCCCGCCLLPLGEGKATENWIKGCATKYNKLGIDVYLEVPYLPV